MLTELTTRVKDAVKDSELLWKLSHSVSHVYNLKFIT